LKADLDGEFEDVTVGGQHQGAGVIEGLDRGLTAVPANVLVLKRGVTVVVQVASIPERTYKSPQEIDQFADPKIAGEVSAVDNEGQKEVVLNFGPSARKASSKQLTPAEHGLFLAETGNSFVVVVIEEARVSTEKLVLQSGE
jgi:hypothetical protein